MVRSKDYHGDEEFYDSTLFGDEFAEELLSSRVATHQLKYSAHKERMKERSRAQSEEGREIGPLPDCAFPEIVDSCRYDLLKFMLRFGNDEQLAAPDFPDPFCDAQLYAIRAVQETILYGGERVLCLPRSFGKTTICEWGIVWALAYGHQKFILIVASKLPMAQQILANVMKIITTYDLFNECFPALCYPIECLDHSPGRAPGQTLDGEHTDIKMNSSIFICPTVPGAPSSGCIVTTSGLDSAVRGTKIGSQRPTWIFLDDPQTEKSAASVKQTERRWDYITGCLKGLVGGRTKLAMSATVTVQRPDDLSEKILEKWGGRRFSMLRSLPLNMDLWDEYAKICQIATRSFETTAERVKPGNRFYLEHREEMDEGAEPEWSCRFTPTEISAIQHAMNLYYDNKKTFYSEYQNQPLAIFEEERNLTYDDISSKILPIPRSVIPLHCSHVTAGVDIQKDCFYWIFTAWGEGFCGHVLDYGRFPSGATSLQELYPKHNEKNAFFRGLLDLLPILGDRTFRREDGTVFSLEKCLIDANNGDFTPQVRSACYRLCRHDEIDPETLTNSQLKDLLSVPCTGNLFPGGLFEPVFGWGKSAEAKFIRHVHLDPGEERGDGWHKLPLNPKNLVRHTRYDTDYWKTMVRTMWQAPVAASGALTLFDGNELTHYDFIQHMLSEKFMSKTGPRGTIDKWTMISGTENHLWDCLIMSAVACATLGNRLESGDLTATASTITYSGNWDNIAS